MWLKDHNECLVCVDCVDVSLLNSNFTQYLLTSNIYIKWYLKMNLKSRINLEIQRCKTEIKPSIACSAETWDLNLVNTVPADGLAPDNVRPSTGTVLITLFLPSSYQPLIGLSCTNLSICDPWGWDRQLIFSSKYDLCFTNTPYQQISILYFIHFLQHD